MAKVTFKKSGITAEWTGDQESLLELGEDQGIVLPFGCRQGNCTACQQPLLEGQIEYPDGHGGEPDDGNALICCCVPKTDVIVDA